MEGLSERAYAAQSGLSRGAVQKARRNGRLVLFADGSINAAASDARRAAATDPDQQMRSRGGLGAVTSSRSGGGGSDVGSASGAGDSTSYLKARTALTVYQAQERQLSIQRKKGVLVDRARAETLVFRLARQERDTWVTWPTRVAALMAAQLSAEMEKAQGKPVTIETAILQRVLEAHVREQLDALADLRVSLG
jgi:phage terminase Nu1 subunit (DNA packaging protein)